MIAGGPSAGLPAELRAEIDAELAAVGADAAPRVPGAVYTRWRAADRSARRAAGSYFTPPHLVDFVVERTLAPLIDGRTREQIASLRILDPACGAGAFLLGAYEWLARRVGPELALEMARGGLCGVDVDPLAAELCRETMALAGVAGVQVAVGDALVGDFPIAGRFDAVIGNPPWGQKGLRFSPRERRYFRERFRCGRGVIDPFALFVERSTELADRFGLVLPDILLLKNQQDCRDLILERCAIEWIADCGQAFAGAAIDVIALVCAADPELAPQVSRSARLLGKAPGRRHSPAAALGSPRLWVDEPVLDPVRDVSSQQRSGPVDGAPSAGEGRGGGLESAADRPPPPSAGEGRGGGREIRPVRIWHRLPEAWRTSPPPTHQLRQSVFAQLPRHTFNIHITEASLALWRKLSRLPRVGDLFEVHEGVHTGNARQRLFVDRPIGDRCVPVIVGRNEIRRGRIEWAGRWLNLDPAALDRSAGHYANLGRPEWHLRPKILVRRTGDRLIAAFDEQGLYCSNNLFVVLAKAPMAAAQQRRVVELLNSELLTWYFRTVQPRTGRLFAELKIHHLLDLPLPADAPGAWPRFARAPAGPPTAEDVFAWYGLDAEESALVRSGQ